MNWKSTLALLIVTAGAGAWLWKGDEWAPRLGLPTAAPAPAASPSLAALADHFTPAAITRIEVPAEAGPPLVLERAATDVGWKLPGNWPLRKPEVDELVALLGHLRTRFQPVPLGDTADLSPYGLADAQKPLAVKVTAGGTAYTLAFGEPKPVPGEPPFARPAYLRVNDNREVLRLGPDVLPVLRRPADSYRRRQLFPDAERVKVAAAPAGPFGGGGVTAVTLPTDTLTGIEARAPGRPRVVFGAPLPTTAGYTLRKTAPFPQPAATEKGGEPVVNPDRIADAWELTAPARDRVDPEKLQKLLATLPELWVEEFVTDAAGAGLDKPERVLTITRPGGEAVVLQFGAVARTATREETVSGPPPMPGFPPLPMTRTITEEYRYAKLAANPQVFVVKADKFADLFAPADDLRDPRLARFAPEEVQELTIAAPGRPAVKLVRKKGDADAWVIDRAPEPTPAEASAVTDLLTQLSGLRVGGADAGDPTGGPTVTIVAREKRPDDQPAAPARTFVLHFGRPGIGAWPVVASPLQALLSAAAGVAGPTGPVPVRADGWPRVASADAAVAKLVAPVGGFRDRTLATATGIDKLTLDRDGRTATFAKTAGVWKQTAPKPGDAEGAELDDLAAALGRLRAEAFAAENPTPADLAKYGLDKPAAKWTAAAGGKDVLTLLVGTKDAEGRAYAKTAAGDVVAVLPAEVSTRVLADFRPRKVWDVDEAKVDAIEVERGGAKFKLARKDAGWEDPAAPKDAIDPVAASGLLAALGGLRAEKWAGAAPADLTRAGLDKPAGTITLTLRDGSKRVLHLGGPVEGSGGKQFYARAAGGEAFVLGALDLARLSRDRASYLGKK